MNSIVAAGMTRQLSVSIALASLLTLSWRGHNAVRAQEMTTTATPTATATFVPTPTVSGPTVFIPDRVNVRSGPGTYYEKVGVLVAGQFAPAVGRTAVGEWIAIEYPEGTGEQAWVYSPLVLK